MAPDLPGFKVQPQTFGSEHKARGANRSTKVAGKLKVLPEQPEPSELPSSSSQRLSKDPEESIGTTGDSEDGDIEDDDEDAEEVEVRPQFST